MSLLVSLPTLFLILKRKYAYPISITTSRKQLMLALIAYNLTFWNCNQLRQESSGSSSWLVFKIWIRKNIIIILEMFSLFQKIIWYDILLIIENRLALFELFHINTHIIHFIRIILFLCVINWLILRFYGLFYVFIIE